MTSTAESLEAIDLVRITEREVLSLTFHEGDMRRGDVPLWLIEDKDVPVNSQNLTVIGTQLDEEAAAKGTDGQMQPILLGLVNGNAKLDIIDGFHRFATFKTRGADTIYATILEVTLEELLDKRIQNTANHSGLQFARASQWIRESWALNPISERISATQAFILGRMKSSNGRKLGLSPEEASDIMAWVDRKSALWGVEPITIYGYLHTDENVDSTLVHHSRPDAQQSSSLDSLPQSTLSSIGRQIPGRTELQRVVARAIVTNKLGGSGISGILSDVKGMDDAEAIEYLSGVDFTAYKEKIAQKAVFRYPEDDILRLGRVRDSSRVKPLTEIAALTGIHVDLVLNEGGFDRDRMRTVGEELIKIIAGLEGVVQKVTTALEGSAEQLETAQASSRSIEDFTTLLAAYLRDPSGDVEILTDREARSAERAVSRGRGTQEALASLQAKIEGYRARDGK